MRIAVDESCCVHLRVFRVYQESAVMVQAVNTAVAPDKVDGISTQHKLKRRWYRTQYKYGSASNTMRDAVARN